MSLGRRAGALVAVLATLVLAYVGLARPWFLRWGATEAERAATYPGDDLVPGQRPVETRAITVQAPASATWAWLAQLGQDRGGFYSYRVLENLVGCDMPSVHRLDPSLETWRAGDRLWMYPPHKLRGIGGAPLVIQQPGRALVFATRSPSKGPSQPDGTWAFFVEPKGPQQSRLIVRGSRVLPTGGAGAFEALMFQPMHFVMERKMMTTIATLAEGGRVSERADDVEVLLWAAVFAAFVTSGALVLAGRRPRRRLATCAFAGVVFAALTLLEPGPPIGFVGAAIAWALLLDPARVAQGGGAQPNANASTVVCDARM